MLLAACAPRTEPPAAPVHAPAARAPAPAPAPAPAVVHGQRSSYDNLDMYKADVAQQIMRSNTAHTFSGRLPEMLPAIVVLSITVEHDGKVSKMFVQRSRDAEASTVALASVERTGLLPRPFNLVSGFKRSLTFSETFLFNDKYQFQLRTLAGPQ
ncbi:MAG: energy transducer TonB [Pseudomonadota bacterium]